MLCNNALQFLVSYLSIYLSICLSICEISPLLFPVNLILFSPMVYVILHTSLSYFIALPIFALAIYHTRSFLQT